VTLESNTKNQKVTTFDPNVCPHQALLLDSSWHKYRPLEMESFLSSASTRVGGGMAEEMKEEKEEE